MMGPTEWRGPPGPGEAHEGLRLRQQVCSVVDEAEFDYAALVDGVHRRAGRIRRRRAMTTGAIVAVLGPALVGGSAMVVPGLLPDGVHGPTNVAGPAPVAQTAPEQTLTQETASEEADPAQTDASEVETAEGPAEAPWQDGELPQPVGGFDSADSGNQWDIPDARPTGVAYLDRFGAPQSGSDYVDVVPVMGALVGNTGLEDPQRPLAGQNWFYFLEDDSWEGGSVDITVTGWQDSTAARDALRDDTSQAFARDGEWQPQEWANHEGDDDYLLHTSSSNGLQLGFALVRQGDYLIGVTVTDREGEVNADVAAEIAAKMADNLEALDPDHGRD